MVLGWRRAFCTSIPKEKDTKVFSGSNTATTRTAAAAAADRSNIASSGNGSSNSGGNNSPRIASRFGFFSNPSTPRLQSKPVSSTSLRCRTTTTTSSSLPTTPKLHCKTKTAPNYKYHTTNTSPNISPNPSPRLLQHSSKSNPSSPKSPSSFSLLKATLRLSKTNRCGICIQSVKTGQGTAIFTAECSHTFHFPCIASHVKKHHILICPVCNTTWKELPLLLSDTPYQDPIQTHPSKPPNITTTSSMSNNNKALRVYNDDESLLSPTSISRFNAIPESDESNEDQAYEEDEFQGFNVVTTGSNCDSAVSQGHFRNVELSLLNEAAVVSANRSYGSTCAVVLKIKAPPSHALRAPIDLVTVLDVSARMNGDKLHMMKRAMRWVLSTLRDSDRLSIVAFSTTSKRLLPLRRMTSTGRRSARRILEAIGCTEQSACVNEALRKAAKVLHDRRERNPVAAMMLLSDGHDQRVHSKTARHKRSYPLVSSTRFGDIPLHAIGFCDRGAWGNAMEEDAFIKCINGLLNVVVQDLKLQLGFVSGSDPAEITAVYSLVGRPTALGSGLTRVGDLYAEEERELLIEIKVPGSCGGSCHVMSVGSSFRDPTSGELVYSKEQPLAVPHPKPVRSQTPGIQRLRNLHVTARSIAESRKLVELNDVSGGYHLLSSARTLLAQSGSTSADEFLRCLEAELAELQRIRHARLASQQRHTGQRERREPPTTPRVEEKPEPLTPTSAWRAAERLAKVAIMRKSMNRVSDLHGFENARF